MTTCYPSSRDADADVHFHSVRTRYLRTYTVSITNSYEHIKGRPGAQRVASTQSGDVRVRIGHPAAAHRDLHALAKQLVYELDRSPCGRVILRVVEPHRAEVEVFDGVHGEGRAPMAAAAS